MNTVKKLWKLGRKEFNTEHLDVNKEGELIVREGNTQYNIYDLVRKFDSPTEIFLPFILEQRLSHLLETFANTAKELDYKGKYFYHYPMKVNQNKEFVLTLVSEGAHLEVSSANELWFVEKLWEEQNFYNKIRVLCNGPKTPHYIRTIEKVRSNGLSIVPIIENLNEFALLKDFKGDIGIRINLKTRVSSHWDHPIDRFGLTSEEILDLGKIKNLKILHYHIGSQIELEKDMIEPVKEAFLTYKKLKKLNPGLDTMDLGGGFAVPYEKKRMYSVESVVKKILQLLRTLSDEARIPHPNVIVEWGRHITAPSQFTIFKIVASKSIEGGAAKFWYIIDGSFMNVLLDTWALHQKWYVLPINKMDAEQRHKVWLAGLSCDSDDEYSSSEGYVLLPRLEDLKPSEDLYIAILDSGAYQDGFAAHHCLLGSPSKVILQNGIVTIARKRENAQDIGKQFGW